MSATPFRVPFTDEDFAERADYNDLTPGDYEATLLDVEDIVASTGNPGWKFTFQVKGLALYTRVYHQGGGKWKIREVFNALGVPIDAGSMIGTLDPNALIGNMCVVTVAKEAKNDGTDEVWTNISRHTPLRTASSIGDAVSLDVAESEGYSL